MSTPRRVRDKPKRTFRWSLSRNVADVMSSFSFLITELQSLSGETRRKHPEIREAAEKAIAILRSSPQSAAILVLDDAQYDEVIRPIFMGCAVRNAKVVAISLSCLQRLISLNAVPHSAVSRIITIMSDEISLGVDIQLRILQTLLSLITNLPTISGDLLGDALLLCFTLYESKIAVVSSTAAATLRQLVMFVVDKVAAEDQRALPPASLHDVTLPDGSQESLGQAARDAYAVFQDLCLLVNSEKPHFLRLETLQKTFALELIESVLTNYHELFRKHMELLMLLPHHLCPLLLKSLSDRPIFPLTLRCTRVVYLLLKQFSRELKTEAEVFLMLFIRFVGPDGDFGGADVRPAWMRVLSIEIIRGLCSDAELMRIIWTHYDEPALTSQSGSKVFISLITALNRLLTEKPALLGVGVQLSGVGVSSSEDAPLSAAGVVAGMVATAAGGVVGMTGTGPGLSMQASSMKIQCIDQLDKFDAPSIPESYVYLLGVQCLNSICEGFSSILGIIYTTRASSPQPAASEAQARSRPESDPHVLVPEDSKTNDLPVVRSMVEHGWPALLAGLSFIIAVNLSDELFLHVLGSYQVMATVSGLLGLTTPRDAFLTSLARLAVPTRVVSGLDSYNEPPTPRTAGSFAETTHMQTQIPGLSERNMACLTVLLSVTMSLAGSLGESWYWVLEAMQNAEYVLAKGAGVFASSGEGNGSGAGGRSIQTSDALPQPASQRPPRLMPLSDLSADGLLISIQRLFEASKNLDDDAFKDFVVALCRLSAEMVNMQTDEAAETAPRGSVDSNDPQSAGLSPKKDAVSRRRVSGIHIPKTLRSGDFGINKLRDVAIINIHRFIYRSPKVAWNPTTSYLLSVIRQSHAPPVIRVQAARALDDILVLVPRNLTKAGEPQASVQRRVLEVLAQQINLGPTYASFTSSTSVELRRMGLETLHAILQASGHTLVVGWEIIFEILSDVCKSAPAPSVNMVETAGEASPSPNVSRAYSVQHPSLTEKGYTALVKIAFQSMTLVCDSVSVLSPEDLRLCITTLAHFGRQADTNIALTAAGSLLWSVSDAIQSKRKEAEKEPEYTALWIFLLLEVLKLCNDARSDVRVGAIQTLFRTMQLYGLTLSLETWEDCIWKVTFPLLDSISQVIRERVPALSAQSNVSTDASSIAWNESKILALHSIGAIFHDFLVSKIMNLPSFTKAWDVFVDHIESSVLLDHRSISAPGLRCLEKAVKACAMAEPSQKGQVDEALHRVWVTWERIGNALARKSPPSSASESGVSRPFTQESLVAFVEVLQRTRIVSRALHGFEWDLERLTKMMQILKGVVTYPESPDYRPDIDGLTPVQAIVIETVRGVDLAVPGSASLLMSDLAAYATLPFLASFSVPSDTSKVSGATNGKATQKRITYIALFKAVMPLLVDLFWQFKDDLDIYVTGTVETVLSAYSIPMKMRYDCPPSSMFGKSPPLWKTATISFLRIVKACAELIRERGKAIPDSRIEGIWQQVLDISRGSVLADRSSIESFDLDVQESEEDFDRSLLNSLQVDVVPVLGDVRVRDSLAAQLAWILLQGSRLHERDTSLFKPRIDDVKTLGKAADDLEGGAPDYQGSTHSGALASRERFSYWCFDLLFFICADATAPRGSQSSGPDQQASLRRLAALSLPYLLKRCRVTMVAYVVDGKLRGNLPLPRAREDELLYVLYKLSELRLWPGSFRSAFPDDPSASHTDAKSLKSTSEILADAVKDSQVAHLFYFYSELCEIASSPRRSATSCVPFAVSIHSSLGFGTELDARALAKQCLELVGKEMAGGGVENQASLELLHPPHYA